MAESFLVEFRLRGYAREYAEWASAQILQKAKNLGIKELGGQRFVSHITLFGGARTNNWKWLTNEVERIGQKYTLAPLNIRGISNFDNKTKQIIYLDVDPSPELEALRWELAQRLTKISFEYQPWDTTPKYEFHSTVGIFQPALGDKFGQLCKYAETQCSLAIFKQQNKSFFGRLFSSISGRDDYDIGINQHLLRITVLKGSRIHCEYDLLLKRQLSRQEALSRYYYRRTIEQLRQVQNLKPQEQSTPVSKPQENGAVISNNDVYFIGDIHLDHNNIIKYCHRPFSNVVEMNNTIINNWNQTVGTNDKVYFLGDYTGPLSRRIYYEKLRYWTERLKGNKISILGNHDRDGGSIKFDKTKVLRVNGYNFLLIHDPLERKTEWHGWIIHGHFHNNKMDNYPFINGERKTINVSADLINFTPVSLNYLLSLELSSIKRMRTIDSEPERWQAWGN